MHRPIRHSTLAVFLLVGLAACSGRATQRVTATGFAELIERLSEPGGYFDTDNLISNEASYLHVVDGLDRIGVSGGAYIGVGPDQNFSYIAAIRPTVAFVIDIRRDNMLQHLIFKALFAESGTRAEYLSLLFGRPPPDAPDEWRDADAVSLADFIDETEASEVSRIAARRRVDARIETFGVTLSAADWQTIDRFHRAFIDAGLSLRFQTHGRAPRYYYPTYRDLLLERTRSGRRANYLASRSAYLVVKSLQDRDLVIPVVGDLAGGHAVRAIARDVENRGERVSAFYTSNVEFYLYRGGSFERFAENLAQLPRDDRSVIVRSVFHTTLGPHPDAVPGYNSTQLLQPMQETAPGRFHSYWEMVTARTLH